MSGACVRNRGPIKFITDGLLAGNTKSTDHPSTCFHRTGLHMNQGFGYGFVNVTIWTPTICRIKAACPDDCRCGSAQERASLLCLRPGHPEPKHSLHRDTGPLGTFQHCSRSPPVLSSLGRANCYCRTARNCSCRTARNCY